MSLVSALLATLITGGLLAAGGWVIFGVTSGSTASAADEPRLAILGIAASNSMNFADLH